jgi:uncharacterized glyoxalase superfamily protein PhnB
MEESKPVHFIFYVKDQGLSAKFYKAVLLTEPRLDVAGMTEFELNKNAILGLMPESGIKALLGDNIADPATASGTARSEIYLTVDDPAAYHARALAAGARELSGLQKRSWGDDAAYCADPDGHVIAFASRSRS